SAALASTESGVRMATGRRSARLSPLRNACRKRASCPFTRPYKRKRSHMTAQEYTDRPTRSASTALENGLALAISAGIDDAAPAPSWGNAASIEAVTIGFTFLVKSRRSATRRGPHRWESACTLAHGMHAAQTQPHSLRRDVDVRTTPRDSLQSRSI